MIRITYICRAVCGLSLLTAAFGAWAQPGQDAPPPVQVATAESRNMTGTILVPGTVVSRDDARLSAEVDGRLVWVADVGTALAAGESAARIEDTGLQLRRDELAAQVEREQARLGFLDAEEERLTELEARNVAAKTQLDQIRSERQMARSELAVARARLAQVEDDIDRTEIRAPFDGVVVERLAQLGERVNPGAPVVRMVAPQSLEVIARAPLDYLMYLEPGDQVPLSTGGRLIEGTVRTLVAVGDENTHLFEVRVDIPGGVLPVGQTVRLTLPSSDPSQVVAVPRDALVLRPQGVAVFVIDEANRAQRVDVTTGLAQGDRIQVEGAINPGDTVVIRGNERLRQGQEVTIQSAMAGDAPSPEPTGS